MLGKFTKRPRPPKSLAKMGCDAHLWARDRARLRAADWLAANLPRDHRAARPILNQLIEHLNDQAPGDGSYPSIATLGGLTGYRPAWVCACLAWLARAGLIARTPGGGRGRSTTYIIHPIFFDARAWPLAAFRVACRAGNLPAWAAENGAFRAPEKPSAPRAKKSLRDNDLARKNRPLAGAGNYPVAGHDHMTQGGGPRRGFAPGGFRPRGFFAGRGSPGPP